MKNVALACFPARGLALAGFVVHALQMQQAMHNQVGKVRLGRLALFGGFAQRHRGA